MISQIKDSNKHYKGYKSISNIQIHSTKVDISQTLAK